jgi:hypothetical protein
MMPLVLAERNSLKNQRSGCRLEGYAVCNRGASARLRSQGLAAVKHSHVESDGASPEMPPELLHEIYQHLLKETHDLADEFLARLWRLHDRYPADLPEDVIDALRQPGGQRCTACRDR